MNLDEYMGHGSLRKVSVVGLKDLSDEHKLSTVERRSHCEMHEIAVVYVILKVQRSQKRLIYVRTIESPGEKEVKGVSYARIAGRRKVGFEMKIRRSKTSTLISAPFTPLGERSKHYLVNTSVLRRERKRERKESIGEFG
jgi:hypothetical protein